MTIFTASEIREESAKVFCDHSISDLECRARRRAMLRAYADRLEAGEKAVPVAWRQRHLAPDGSQIGWILTETRPAYFYTEPLYTNRAPADAERLAEALHNLRDAQKHYMEHRTSASEIREPLGQLVAQRAAEADAVLATYSAQVQPPYHECDHT